MKAERPPIGTTMYCVREHLYYKPGRAGPLTEYVVFAGKIKRYLEFKRVEMELVGPGPDVYVEVAYYDVKSIGKSVFFTAKEAAELAKQRTEHYEQHWGFLLDAPLRRPWKELLKEG